MSDSEFSELEARLRSYGGHAVAPATQSQHLTTMASVAAAPARRSSVAHKLRVAGALVAGFFLGSTGLAFAGALPDPAQDAAQGAFARVGVNVPAGTERYQGAECGEPEGGGEWRNHGHYVRSQPEAAREAAGESDCGKPLQSLENGGDDADVESEGAGEPNDCAAKGQAIAGANKERRAKPDNPGKPAHAGKPETTGKPACTPDGGNETSEQGDANDAVTPQNEGTPADPDEKPVETPAGPPDDTGGDAGDSQGVKGDTPGAEEGEVPEETPSSEGAGNVPEETPPSDAGEGNVPEQTPPAGAGDEEAPPED